MLWLFRRVMCKIVKWFDNHFDVRERVAFEAVGGELITPLWNRPWASIH